MRGVRIDPALIKHLQDSLQSIERLQQLDPSRPLPPKAREMLTFCAASDAVPEEMGALARRLLFAAPSSALESVVTQNAEGEWVHTLFVDLSHARGDWYYAVKHADEGEPAELRALLLAPDAEMTDEGRALLSDFVWRYGIKGRFNRSWDMKTRARLARAEWKKRRARPATPIYERSDVDARIDFRRRRMHRQLHS